MKTRLFRRLSAALCLLAALLSAAVPAYAERGALTPETLTLQPGGDDTSLLVTWYGDTDDGALALVRCTPETGEAVTASGSVAAASAGTYTHRVSVTGLAPGVTYACAVSDDGETWFDPFSYTVPDGGDFTFAWVSDPQLVNWVQDRRSAVSAGVSIAQGWEDTLARVASSDASLLVSSGDQVDTTFKWLESEYALLLSPGALTGLPFAPAVGNHDRNAGFVRHFTLPNEQDVSDLLAGSSAATNVTSARGNYYFRRGCALFVFLNDSPYPADADRAAPFIAAFDRTLSAAVTENPDVQWLFVVHHKSTESLGVHAAAGDTAAYTDAGFEALMDKYGVDAVLAGHEHYYQRSLPLRAGRAAAGVSDTYTDAAGTLYLTANTASGVKYYGAAAAPGTLAVSAQAYIPGYALIDVSEEAVRFTVYNTYADADGKTVLDTFTLQKTTRPADRLNFRDLTGHWAEETALAAADAGILTGTGPVTFSPDAPLTRAMALTALCRLAGEDPDTGASPWYAGALSWAVSAGISDGTDMTGAVTREQLAALLFRLAGTPETAPDLSAFSDAGEAAPWARTALSWAVSAGILRGDGGALRPGAGATRAEAAAMFLRFQSAAA